MPERCRLIGALAQAQYTQFLPPCQPQKHTFSQKNTLFPQLPPKKHPNHHPRGKSRRRIDGIYKHIDYFPKQLNGHNMKSEAESVFLGNVRFIVDQIRETTVKDKKGRLKTIVYIDVREE